MGKSRQELEEEFFMTADWDKICVNAGLKPKSRRVFYVDTSDLTPEQVKEAIDKARAKLSESSGKVDLKYDPMKIDEDFFVAKIDRERYPHECPSCKAPAYIGLNSADCSKGCK